MDLESILFSVKKIEKQLIAEFLTQESYNLFLQDLTENNISISDAKILSIFITKALETINKVPKINFTFAISPMAKTIENIVTDISTDDKRYVISFVVDPSIYGGVLIMKDGLTYDYSIRKSIEPIILQSQLLK